MNYGECLKERRRRTFEKWYSFGNDISIDKFPSFDEMASMVIGTVSADGRLLRRLKDLDFGLGGWNPLSSKVQSSNSLVFKSRYRIKLLFVSAMNILPEKRINNNSKTKLISNLFHFIPKNWIKGSTSSFCISSLIKSVVRWKEWMADLTSFPNVEIIGF